jgi:hypothetical protein
VPAGTTPGYDGEVACYDAFNVNLDASEADDYAYMVAHGASVYYRGHAVWKGNESQYGCTQTKTAAATGDAGAYDFSKSPEKGMDFRFAFSTPTNYVNCPRGIQVSTSQSVIAQVTVHMDHPFWESFAEDTPVHWDQIAAQYVGVKTPLDDAGFLEAHLEDFHGVPFQGFTDHEGVAIPWRNCAGPNYTPPGNGQMSFSTLTVPVDPHGTDPSKAIRDYYDYIRYTQSTQGHLNSQGICYIDRQFPSPPGGS